MRLVEDSDSDSDANANARVPTNKFTTVDVH